MEFLIVFTYLILILFIARQIQSRNLARGKREYRFFFNGLFVKLVGAILYCYIYLYIYGYGDSIQYFKISYAFNQFAQEHFLEWLKLIFSSSEQLQSEKYELTSGYSIYTTVSGAHAFYYEPDLFLMGKIGSFLMFPAFNSFYMLGCFFATLSFSGFWRLFQTVIKIYPNYKSQIGFAVFFIPSVVLFGSPVMKDSITISALGWFFYGVYNIFSNRKTGLSRNLLWIIIAIYLLSILKAYILICFLIAMCVWLAIFYNNSIKNTFFRTILFPVIFLIVGFVAINGIIYIADSSEKYKVGNIKSTAKGYQSYHGTMAADEGGGSSYTLGDLDYSTIGIIRKVPAAINVTFFRPYLWETKSPMMIPSAIESFCLLILTGYLMFYKIGIRRFFMLLITNEFALLCFIFALTLGFAVGFTSFNFGALVRYKIPAMLFYIIGLSVIYTEYDRTKYRAKIN